MLLTGRPGVEDDLVLHSSRAGVVWQVRPQQYATGAGWRTTWTKIVDNALIGCCMMELGERQPADAAANQVSFDVSGTIYTVRVW